MARESDFVTTYESFRFTFTGTISRKYNTRQLRSMSRTQAGVHFFYCVPKLMVAPIIRQQVAIKADGFKPNDYAEFVIQQQ